MKVHSVVFDYERTSALAVIQLWRAPMGLAHSIRSNALGLTLSDSTASGCLPAFQNVNGLAPCEGRRERRAHISNATDGLSPHNASLCCKGVDTRFRKGKCLEKFCT